MDRLNDDCQLQIIKLLELTDQLNLFEATKDEAMKRWVSNLRFTWQHQLSFCLDENLFDSFDRKPELLHDFQTNISPTIDG